MNFFRGLLIGLPIAAVMWIILGIVLWSLS
jgi:tetrahydromethanopterin S-methyltransferase subunit B